MIHKICGTISYAKFFYAHYFIQHIRSHHKHVATPLDPATAKIGESVFDYYIRGIPEGFVEVWHFEVKRL